MTGSIKEPEGVEHYPLAKEEAHILLIEPRTPNTGDTATAAARDVI